MEYQDNNALFNSSDSLLPKSSEHETLSQSSQPLAKRKGRPRKIKPNTLQAIKLPNKSADPLFEEKFMPAEDIRLANISSIMPSKYGIPFTVSIYSSKQHKQNVAQTTYLQDS